MMYANLKKGEKERPIKMMIKTKRGKKGKNDSF